MRGRIVLVAEIDQQWPALVRALEDDNWEVDILTPRTTTAEVVACAARDRAIVIVDLAADPSAAVATVAACRAARTGPVIAVAANPSADVTRRIRQAGAYYLALHPLDPDEMRSILESASRSIGLGVTSPTACQATPRILIIDDDRDFVASTAALLEACGYSVSWAFNGREGLEKARAARPDLIVLDVMMEHDSAGYEVNQAVKFAAPDEDLRHIPILMVSSIELSPDVRFCLAGEAPLVTPNAYLTKPLDIERFLVEVAALVCAPREQFAGAGA